MFTMDAGYSLLTAAALKSTAVLGAAWLLAFLLRKRSAAARHLVWTAAFGALLLVPLLSVSLPSLRIPVSGRLLAPAVLFTAGTIATANPTSVAQTSPAERLAGHGKPTGFEWREVVAALWVSGVALAFLQFMHAWILVWNIRRRATRKDDPAAPRLAAALGIEHAVELLETDRGSMPMTFGLVRPAVMLPADAWEWSDERRRVVLLHEFAHVRRADVAKHLLARATLSFYWWHPLAWVGWRAFLKDRERAADDLVLTAGAAASEYASHLLDIARSMQAAQCMDWAAVAMVRKSQLEDRMLAILDEHVDRNTPGRAGVAAVLLGAALIVAPLSAVKAQEGSPSAALADLDTTIRAARAQRKPALLDEVAKAAESMRNIEAARQLLQASLSIRAEVSGDRSADYGMGLLKLGQLEHRRGRFNDASGFYSRAVAILNDSPQAAPALIDLGIEAMIDKDMALARSYFERAKAANPGKSGAALMWMSVVSEKEGKLEQAEAQLRQAVSLQPVESPESATALEMYALYLRRHGREIEVGPLLQQAGTVRRAEASNRPAIGANVYQISETTTKPKVLSKREPQYSEEARLAKYEGTVVLMVEIGPDGLAHNTRVTRGLGLGLDEKAVEAVTQWTFQPATKDGQPVTVGAQIEINFRLM